jgi:hypothetical protein
VLLGLALIAALGGPTHITAMHLAQRGVGSGPNYHVRVTVRLRVCGRPGRVRFHVTETSSPPGRDTPVTARQRRAFTRGQEAACTRHRLTWTLGDRFFGVSRYTVALRARTSGRRWSAPASRHADTTD